MLRRLTNNVILFLYVLTPINTWYALVIEFSFHILLLFLFHFLVLILIYVPVA